jgi:hypothetical protein
VQVVAPDAPSRGKEVEGDTRSMGDQVGWKMDSGVAESRQVANVRTIRLSRPRCATAIRAPSGDHAIGTRRLLIPQPKTHATPR